MSDDLHPLILDLVEWVGKAPRRYTEVMDAWRTYCPRLPVWEDAVDKGYLVRERQEGRGAMVVVTPHGRQFLADNDRLPLQNPASGGQSGAPAADLTYTRTH